MTTKTIDTKMPLECSDCGAQWEEHFCLPMNAEAFIKKSKAITCPECSSKKIYMFPKDDGMKFPEVPDKITVRIDSVHPLPPAEPKEPTQPVVKLLKPGAMERFSIETTYPYEKKG